MSKLNTVKMTEPILSNRWVVNMGGGKLMKEIPKHIFKNFELSTKDKGIKLTLLTHNLVDFLNTPELYIDEKKIVIEFLDPTCTVVENFDMSVVFDSFKVVGDYGDDSILTSEISYWVRDIRTFRDNELDKKIMENYLKNKEKNLKNDRQE
jgi:hypothetical protein